jgi:hypothetical protein
MQMRSKFTALAALIALLGAMLAMGGLFSPASADKGGNKGGANSTACPGGKYCAETDPGPSGNGQGKAPHVAGSRGKADNKNPPGQMNNPNSNGYECGGNKGIAKKNPAHTGCKTPTTPPGGCTENCNPPGGCTVNCNPPGGGGGGGGNPPTVRGTQGSTPTIAGVEASRQSAAVAGAEAAQAPVPIAVTAGTVGDEGSSTALVGQLLAGLALLLTAGLFGSRRFSRR